LLLSPFAATNKMNKQIELSTLARFVCCSIPNIVYGKCIEVGGSGIKELIVLGLERTMREIQIVRVNNGKMEVIKGF